MSRAAHQLIYEEAKAIAAAYVAREIPCMLLEHLTREHPFGWVFFWNSKAYVEKGDAGAALIGNGPFLVERQGGRVVQFGSGISVERSVAHYQNGYRFDRYEIVVESVTNAEMVADLLQSVDLVFVVPEEAHGAVWRIPQIYSITQLRDMLTRQPVVFQRQRLAFREDEFDRLRGSGACRVRFSEDTSNGDPGPIPPATTPRS